MKQALSLLVILMITAQCGFTQTNYYVDGAGGSDGNTGTTLLTAWKTIQHACNAATPNSIVQIKGGTYPENIVVNVSGTAASPITFRNYQHDSVFIDGTGTAGTTMLQITDKNYLTFQGLVIQNLTVNNAQGILLESSVSGTSTGVAFKRMVVRYINWTSSAATIPTANDNAQAIIVYGRDNGLTNLSIDSCIVYANILGFSEAVSIDGNVKDFSVTNCLVHDNTNIGILAAGNYGTSTNPVTDHARNGIISQNLCYRNVSSYATSGGIYADGGKNVLIEKNKCYENGYGIELGCEQNGSTDSITVKNNLFYNNQVCGIAIGGYTTSTTGQVLNCIIRNNTFFQNDYSNSGSGEMDMTKASQCTFENNIFYTNGQNILFTLENIGPQTGNVFNYNCWYTPLNDSTNLTVNYPSATYTSFASYRTGTAQDLHSHFGDPALTSIILPSPDLHVQSTSPCINSGDPATIISSGETDYEGNPRIGAGRIDIGAFEYTLISGIAEKYPEDKGWLLYPDPATERISIKTSSLVLCIDLLNAEGTEVRHCQHPPESLPVYDLPPGLYFIRISFQNGNVRVGKFVRN